MKELAPDAIERGIACLRRMRRIVDSYGATLRAVATSAVREAANAGVFLDRARARGRASRSRSSPGAEEARLIHLGVLQAVPVFDRRLLLVDIGGGSTELLIGEKGETLAARSFKLGAVRLTDRFFPERRRRPPKQVAACREYVRGILSHFQREVDEHGFDVAVASSGTAEAVAHVAHALTGAEPLKTYNCFEISRRRRAPRRQGARPPPHRGRPGPGPRPRARAGRHRRRRRADPGDGRHDVRRRGVHVQRGRAARRRAGRHAGADLERPRGRHRPDGLHHLRDVSRRSIRQLAERCDDDPAHSAHVARLAVELFDALQPLHDLDGTAREYLEAGALLANVGLVVAHSKHHLHAYYVIRNSELAGLTDLEIEIIAQIARYHRKSEPKASHAEFAALDADDQAPRAHARRHPAGRHRARPQPPRARRVGARRGAGRAGSSCSPRPRPGADVGLELYAANERKDLLERVIGRRVELLPG